MSGLSRSLRSKEACVAMDAKDEGYNHEATTEVIKVGDGIHKQLNYTPYSV